MEIKKIKHIMLIAFVDKQVTHVRLFRETIAFHKKKGEQVQLPAKALVTILARNDTQITIRYKRTEYVVGSLEIVEWED